MVEPARDGSELLPVPGTGTAPRVVAGAGRLGLTLQGSGATAGGDRPETVLQSRDPMPGPPAYPGSDEPPVELGITLNSLNLDALLEAAHRAAVDQTRSGVGEAR